MKKLSLTKHVQTRRRGGAIPPTRLRFVMNHLIDQHNMMDDDKVDGAYKFRKDGTHAIIVKKGGSFCFITFFGPTGYVINSDDIGEFNCIFQSPEYLQAKEDRKINKIQNGLKAKKEAKIVEPLKHLSATNKTKIKRGTFSVIVLDPKHQETLHNQFGQRPYHILVSNFNSYGIVEILGYNGVVVKIIHKNILIGLGIEV